MTFSYNVKIKTATDKVRLLLGDTNTADATQQLLQDEEITFFLSDENQNVYRAAACCAEAVAAKFAQKVDFAVEKQIAQTASQLMKQYQALACQLRRKASRRGVLPLAGGISFAQAQQWQQDDDLIKPTFTTTMQSEPGTDEDNPPAIPFQQPVPY